jgi:predicted permease
MDRVLTVAKVIAPIFVAIFLGFYARRKKLMSPEEIKGLQQFVMKFGLPCVVFNSCLTANMGVESLSSMALTLPVVAVGTLWTFRARKKKYPYHNLPQLFDAQETGMLGIPLVIILFGADQAYRMGVLDLTQAIVCYPVIAILTADAGENISVGQLVKKVLTSPLLIMSLLGLGLNLSGIAAWMDSIGIGGIITESTGFLSQPISAMMIFAVGYNFSLEKDCRKDIMQISAIHFVYYALGGVLVQLALCLIPGIDMVTRLVLLMYFTLPASYLAPSLGRSQRDNRMASGVCSVLTVVSLAIFCVMAAFVA